LTLGQRLLTELQPAYKAEIAIVLSPSEIRSELLTFLIKNDKLGSIDNSHQHQITKVASKSRTVFEKTFSLHIVR
jgi:hypothetical protein